MAKRLLFVLGVMTFLFISLVNAESYNITTQPEIAFHLVNGSLIFDEGVNDYESKINVTSGLSDSSDSTRYSISMGDNDIYNFYYMFNDYSLSEGYDSSGNGNPMTIMSNAMISENLDVYSLQTTNSNGGGAKSLHKDEFHIGNTDFSIGFIINFTSATAFSKYVMRKYEFPVGYYMYLESTNRLRVYFRDSNAVGNNLISTTYFNDGDYHSVVIRRNITSGQLQMVVDGVVEANSTINTFGNYSNFAILEIGTISASYGFNGFMDEVFTTNTYLSDSETSSFHTEQHLYDEDSGDAIEVFFDVEINLSESFSLHINKYDFGDSPVRIYTYINSTHINSSNYLDSTLSQGSNYIDITGFINDGYNLPFRIGNLHNDIEISEIELYEVGNDTTPPRIFDCFVNTSFVGCNDSVTWGCHIEDDSAVTNSWGKVNIVGTNHTITRQAFQNPINESIWEVVLDAETIRLLFESVGWTFDSYLNISLSYINATDVAGNTQENSSFSPSIWNIYGCLLCFEDWVENFELCLINDSQLKYYEDANSCTNSPYNTPLPIDNGTYFSCNYCSSDINPVESVCTFQNGTYVKDVSYVDNLYSFCCAVTYLPSDCEIDTSPFNETTQDFCTIFNNTMDCDTNTYTEYGFFGDKVRWICYPPVSSNTTTNCMSYVKDPSHGVIQTNPNYYTRTDSLISLDNEYEDRTSFEAVGNMVSIYFTKDNLMFDGRDYIFGVRCTADGNYYTYDQLIIPEYENVNAPITRFFWIKGNVLPIILAGLITTIIIIAVAIHLRELRRR